MESGFIAQSSNLSSQLKAEGPILSFTTWQLNLGQKIATFE
jgi:hypothetical protein